MSKNVKKILGGVVAAMLVSSIIAPLKIYAANSAADALYGNAYDATQAAESSPTQKSINFARKTISVLNGTGANWAIGEFSKQIDQLQQPILVKAITAIKAAQASPSQDNVNVAKAAIDPDLPLEWKRSYSSAVDAVEQGILSNVMQAYDKAKQTNQKADIDAANNLLSVIETSTDISLAGWAGTMKGQLSNSSITDSNGSKYVGEIKNGMPNGLGTMTASSGNIYIGNFSDGVRSGQEYIKYTNGDTYQGGFSNSSENGQGTYTWSDGTSYVGDNKNGKRDGEGIILYANGNSYVGQFQDGKFNGQGTYIWADGSIYVGQWQDGKRNGQGKLSMYTGKVEQGQWVNDTYSGN